MGIAPGQVHRPFGRPGKGLAELVAGHEQPLVGKFARRMKLTLLGIGPVVLQPISAASAGHLRFDPLGRLPQQERIG